MRHARILIFFVACLGAFAASAHAQECPPDKGRLGVVRRITSVIVLLFVSSPTYISRLVMSVVVNPVERVFLTRTSPYRVDELLNRFEAKFYTASTVITKAFMLVVRASLFCRIVATELARRFMVQAFSVGDCCYTRTLFADAPTRRVGISDQVGRGGSEKRPTIASGKPPDFSSFRAVVDAQNQYMSKTFAGQIFEITSGWNERFKLCS